MKFKVFLWTSTLIHETLKLFCSLCQNILSLYMHAHTHICTSTDKHVYIKHSWHMFYLRIIFLPPLSHSQFSTHQSDVSQTNTRNFSPRSPSNTWLPNLAMSPLPLFLLQPIQLTYVLPQHFLSWCVSLTLMASILHYSDFWAPLPRSFPWPPT